MKKKLQYFVGELKEGFWMGYIRRIMKNQGLHNECIFINDDRIGVPALYSYADHVVVFSFPLIEEKRKELGLNMIYYLNLLVLDLYNIIEQHRETAAS